MATTASISAARQSAFDEADWRLSGRVIDVTGGYDANSKTLWLHLSDGADTPEIELPDCPAERVEIHLVPEVPRKFRTSRRAAIPVQLGTAFKCLTIVVGVGHRQAHFDLSEGSPYENLTVAPWRTSNRDGEVHPASRRRVSVEPGPSATCEVRYAELFLRHPNLTIPEVRLEEAYFGAEVLEIERLDFSGECQIRTTSTIHLLASQANALLGTSDDKTAQLNVDELSIQPDGLTLKSGMTLAARNMIGGTVRLRSGSSLQITGSGRDTRVYGPGALRLNARALADGFQMLSDDPNDKSLSPLLVLGDSAVFRQGAGSVRLGPCMNSQIEGDERKGLLICAIESSEGIEQPLLGSVLRAARFPIEFESLPLIGAVQSQCAVAVPLVTIRLPGRRRERKEAAQRKSGTSDENMRADFAMSLARLAETKGAPPSTRTRIAWLDYRMRLSQAKGVEKWILWGYRSIGFGERAGPPALLFVALCLGFAAVELQGLRFDLTWHGVFNFAETAFNWAISPLHLISGKVGPDDSAHPTLVAAARASLAVVFGTAALALRKYVKREAQPPA